MARSEDPDPPKWEVEFSAMARADLFEALPLIRPDLVGRIPPVHRRGDQLPKGKSRAGRPRDPVFALHRFSRYFLALEQFEAARDLRDAERTAKRTGVSVRAVLRDKMSDEDAEATFGLGAHILLRAKALRQRRRKTVTDTALRQACGLTKRAKSSLFDPLPKKK